MFFRLFLLPSTFFHPWCATARPAELQQPRPLFFIALISLMCTLVKKPWHSNEPEGFLLLASSCRIWKKGTERKTKSRKAKVQTMMSQLIIPPLSFEKWYSNCRFGVVKLALQPKVLKTCAAVYTETISVGAWAWNMGPLALHRSGWSSPWLPWDSPSIWSTPLRSWSPSF